MITRPCTHKTRRDVRFDLKATEFPRRSEMTRGARNRHRRALLGCPITRIRFINVRLDRLGGGNVGGASGRIAAFSLAMPPGRQDEHEFC